MIHNKKHVIKNLSIIVSLLFLSYFSFAQKSFEILIPWENDTSVSGLYAKEMPDSSFLILSNNQYFYPDSGILFEGPQTYGTGLIKVSDKGSILWKRMYSTNNFSGFGSTGRTPAASYYQLQNSIIIPFSMSVGLMVCDSIGSSQLVADTYKTGTAKVDMKTGDLMEMYIYYGDTLCSDNSFMAFAAINDSVTVAMEVNGWNDDNYLIIRSFSDSIISKYPLDSNYSIMSSARFPFLYEEKVVYQPTDTSFVSIVYDKISGSKKLVHINSMGEVTELFTPKLNPLQSLEAFNKSYFIIYDLFDSINGTYLNTHLFKFSENGNIQKEITFDIIRPVDLEITPDGKILLLASKSQGSISDSMYQPLRVLLLDTNLNIISYKDFGFAFVSPKHITYTSDGGFIVTGTRLKSMDEVNGKEPDQVYFLKSHIDSINILWTNTPKIDKVKELFIKVYPNPTTGKITIQFNHSQNGDAILMIYNVQGKLVYEAEAIQPQVNISSLPDGIYLLQIEQKEAVIRENIIKLCD